jgi:hypothetical protein
MVGAPPSSAHAAPELEIEPEALVEDGAADPLVACEVGSVPPPPPVLNVFPSRPRSAVQLASEMAPVASPKPRRRAIHRSQQEPDEGRKATDELEHLRGVAWVAQMIRTSAWTGVAQPMR